MKSIRSRFIAAVLIGSTVIAFAQLSPQKAAAQSQSILIYNAQHASLTQAWANAFARDTGIKVTIRNGGDSELGNQIVQEGSASPADVFLTENSPAMVLVDGAGLFAPPPAEILSQVREPFRPANGRWVGVAARTTVFTYNKNRLTTALLPKSLLDLADPAWKGRWGASPAGADFQAIVSALLEIKGEAATAAWLKAMKQNAVPFRGNVAALKAVNSGEVEGAVIYHYYYFGDQARTGENSNNTALHYFRNQDPGAFISVSGGGVLASSKHPSEAQAFLKWLTGNAGQEILRTGDAYEYAVGIGAQSNPKLVPLADLQAPNVDPSKLNGKKTIELMMQAGLL
jgi:iron(III) transport system substrate-binding protein